MAEKILPLPVKRNKFGVRVADLTTTEYYRQIEEEVLEAYKAAIEERVIATMERDGCGSCSEFVDSKLGDEAHELVDIIATCITRLEILGYDVSEREKLYATCNEKNAKRGYFKEGD